MREDLVRIDLLRDMQHLHRHCDSGEDTTLMDLMHVLHSQASFGYNLQDYWRQMPRCQLQTLLRNTIRSSTDCALLRRSGEVAS